ncbi:MAG TPA: GNAT family N-acetyltransferase [Actinomycetota bacterium]|nr:GNAT family N-acetyltransferase [Actinomycetota bacterium]
MIRKARADDRDNVIETLTLAFAADPIIRFQFWDDQTYPARATAFFGHYFDVRLEGGDIFVADGGAALWSPPGGNRLGSEAVESDWEKNVVPALDEDELARYARFKTLLDAMTPAQPHWYLGLLGTRPDKQRMGVARGLLEPMLARADRESLPVFLETAGKGNLDFYARFGFEPIAEDTVSNGPVVWGLLKRPR